MKNPGLLALGVASTLRRVKSKAPALQNKSCKVETQCIASLHTRRSLETTPSGVSSLRDLVTKPHMSRRDDTLDDTGIQPDFFIDSEIPDYQWFDYVKKILNMNK